jgi:hypothetical protein
MPLLVWVAGFAATSLLWAWILFWGGAEWLEGTMASGFLHVLAYRWSADGIKLFVGLTWLFEGIWFAIGLFLPSARFWR